MGLGKGLQKADINNFQLKISDVFVKKTKIKNVDTKKASSLTPGQGWPEEIHYGLRRRSMSPLL